MYGHNSKVLRLIKNAVRCTNLNIYTFLYLWVTCAGNQLHYIFIF